jgi:hypothetical protein
MIPLAALCLRPYPENRPQLSSEFKQTSWGSNQMSARKLPTAKPIERQAYDLRLEQGCEDDCDLADWVAPERKLTELSEASVLRRPAKLDRA